MSWTCTPWQSGSSYPAVSAQASSHPWGLPLLKHHVQTSDVEGDGVKTEVGKKFPYPGRVDERIDFNSVDKIQPVIDFAKQVFRVKKKTLSFSQLRS